MEKNESNITRDHLAMEAMKVIMDKCVKARITLKTRIKMLFGIPAACGVVVPNPEILAQISYKVSDAMIAARRQAEEKEEGGENE